MKKNQPKKKILHVSYGGLGFGGVSTVIFSIVEPLAEEYEFGCVVFQTRGEREEKFTALGGRLHRLPCYPENGKRSAFELLTRPFRLYFGIRKICKEYGYDIIHVHNGAEGGICLVGAKAAGVKMRIAHSHNAPSPKRKSFLKLFREKWGWSKTRKYATHWVGCSSLAASSVFGDAPYQVIVNAADLSRFSLSRRIPHEGLRAIHVGRYCYQKNQSFVLRVFARLLSADPNGKLELVGFGEDEEKLKHEIEALGLSHAVSLVPGKGADVAAHLAEADVMIFPSNFEGFGIALIEAQAMGVHCFVSEAIQPEADAGLMTSLTLADGEEAWANAILAHVKENQTVDGERLTVALSRFSKEAVAEEYRMLYGKGALN